MLALSIAFIASFSLLGVATVQLTQRARSLDREHDTAESALRLSRELWHAQGNPELRFAAVSAILVGRNGVPAIEWIRRTQHLVAGHPVGRYVEQAMPDGTTLRVWFREPAAADATPVTNLLLLYVAVTGGGILLLTYVFLTYLIVRPVESVTRASERLASGSQFVNVPEEGAGEVMRLAVAFNEMARQLRAERSTLEQQLGELERSAAHLRTAQDQLLRSEKLASVGRLSAGVAHEIGNPLAAILGMLELLRDGDTDPALSKEFLRRIQSETERINKIIRDLLDFSRQGHAPSADGETDVAAVVEDAVRLIAPQKDLHGVTIERRLAADAPPVRGVADQITQVVLNLLLNAADAIHGEGTIQIEVAASADREWVELAVTDTGPGIDARVVDHLFEPFVTTKPTGEGTGLGLAVCHTIVERLGGTIRAENPPGGGARFVMRLPASHASRSQG